MIRIESLLRREIGLDAASIGSSQIHRTVRLRMKHLALKKTDEYYRLLGASSKELEELVEAVVVTETWFFRDGEPFVAFREFALPWLAKHPTERLRVLSVPCSSGEEPYSLAMALLDLKIPAHRFEIHGVDISLLALTRAKHAIYGKNSFRAKDLGFRDRYFRHTKDGYVLNPVVTDCVQFHRDNLLGDEFLVGHAPYHFVFCRNLLIYFDRATQIRALERIHHLLAPQGVLFVGPAELPLVTENHFVNANIPMAFACRKAGAEQGGLPGLSASAKADKPGSVASQPDNWLALTTMAGAPALALQRPGAAPVGLKTPGELGELEVARQLADAGRLAEAAALCEADIQKQGPSAQAYYLLGLVRDSQRDATAVAFYRKALYLDPNHYETLLQMSLLLEKSGDTAGARTFKKRAERAQPKA